MLSGEKSNKKNDNMTAEGFSKTKKKLMQDNLICTKDFIVVLLLSKTPIALALWYT